MKAFYSNKYNNTDVEFNTTRKADRLADSLADRPIDNVSLVGPSDEWIALTAEMIDRYHAAEYVRALRTGKPHRLAATNGIGWDDRLFAAVNASTAGLVAATFEAIETGGASGSFSSGLHHARYDQGNGFCTVNGIAIAALAAAESLDGRAVIVDFDAHCGGGTANLLDQHDSAGRVSQVDVSVSSFDCDYPIRPDRYRRVVIKPGPDTIHDVYLTECGRALDRIDPAGVGVVIYNAGMDPHGGAGGRFGITADTLAEREQLVFDWARAANLPIAFALAGGYTIGIDWDELVDLHRSTVLAAATE